MSPPTPDSVDESAPPPTGEALIRLLREELIKTQLIVLELNDRVLERETDKADALSILGRLELQLEQKIDRITLLQTEHAQEIEEARVRLQSAELDRQASEAVIQNLSDQLASARQEITRIQATANDVAQQLVVADQSNISKEDRLRQWAAALAETEAQLAMARRQLNTIFTSRLWRLGRPWRAIFGPKV
jgi:chromosome segregation ATPase